MINLDLIPHLSEHLYIKKIQGFALLYNPYSQKGIFLLNWRAHMLFKSIDGKRSIEDCLIKANKGKKNLSKNEAVEIFSNLHEYEIIEFKDQKQLERNNPLSKSSPLTMWIDLTEQCNFRCTYCFVSKNPKRMNEVVINTMIDRLYLLKGKGFERVQLGLAGGEPLLELDLIKKIVEKVKTKDQEGYPFFIIGVVTNGSLLTKDTASYLKKNNIKISISLDGIGKINDLTRKFADGSGTFSYIKKGVNIAKEYGILEGVQVTITTKNIKNLQPVVEYCLENKIKMTFDLYKKNNDLCSEKKFDDLEIVSTSYKKILKDIYSFYEKEEIFRSPLLDHSLIDGLKYPSIGNESENSCTAGTTYFSINPEGKIRACPASNFTIGDIKDRDSILKAKNNFSSFWKKMSIENVRECQNCPWKYICAGGCAIERAHLNKGGNKSSYKCRFYRSLIPMVLEFEAKRIIKKNYLSKIKK